MKVLDGNFKTTHHISEELKMEYPEEFNDALEDYREQHDFSTCSTYMSPLMLVGGVLSRMLEEERVERCQLDGENAWRKKSPGRIRSV